MRIAQIAPPWISIPPKDYGGTENVLYHLIEEQIAQGHEVTLLAPGDAQTSARQIQFYSTSLREEGVPWQAHLKAYYHLYKSLEYIRRHDFDIVHTHLSSYVDMYLFPLLAALETPHITTMHSLLPFDIVPGTTWIGNADSFYMEWAPFNPMVAISESALHMQKDFPLRFVGVVHHGIPLKLFRPLAVRHEDFFVWIGNFAATKGAHVAIEVAKQAQVSLILAGIVDSSRPELMKYFEEMICPHIDGEQIRYIGPVNSQQKIDILSRARGFLNPILWEEPFGMVMIEAMALGCPVITFDRGAAPELVKTRETGFLVRTVDEMVSVLPFTDQLDREKIRLHIADNFSVQVMAEKYIQVYNKVMAKEPALPG